jgi:hypothetical protein
VSSPHILEASSIAGSEALEDQSYTLLQVQVDATATVGEGVRMVCSNDQQ